LLAGYNFQAGGFVFGVQADLEYTGTGKNIISAVPGSPIRDEVQLDWKGHALARVGYAAGNGWLPYFTGGAVFAHVKASHTGFVTQTDTFTWRASNWRTGYTLGGGVEKRIAAGLWSVRAEYLYDYWGAKHYEWVPNQRYSNIALRVDTIRISVIRRF
jgi:outer membrane immunogenic protein